MTRARLVWVSGLCAVGIAGAALFAPTLGAQATPDRSHPPALEAAPGLNLPPIQKRRLSNGLPVWVIETHEVPLVQVTLIVGAGSGDDPAGKFGVGSMTAAMLDEGAGARSALELADAVEFLGATLTTGSSFDESVVRLNVPVRRLTDALPLMADVALRPTFPLADLDRLRQERLTALLQGRGDPQAIATRAFSRLVFGAMHRYGTSGQGTEATLKALAPADLRTFHAAFYQPSNATLVVVGDVGVDAVMPMLESVFGPWTNRGAIRRATVPTAPALASGQIYIVDKPDAAQSVIQIGGIGVSRSTPDYFPIQIANTILGGSFSSRLNLNLREQHGYAYGAGSGFDMRLSAGIFAARAAVQTDKTADALHEFFNELDAIGAKPVTSEELARATNYLALSFPGQFETSGDLSQQLEELIVYGLPEDYYSRYVAEIQKVTIADVQRIAKKYVTPSTFAVLIVGDRRTIEPGIRALKLPQPIRVMTVDEALGPG
jgi:predicted Zn-dependent peptidase